MRYKTKIILGNYLAGAQSRFYKIIGLFAYIDHYRDKRKQYNSKEEGGEKLFKNIPVEFFDHSCVEKLGGENR